MAPLLDAMYLPDAKDTHTFRHCSVAIPGTPSTITRNSSAAQRNNTPASENFVFNRWASACSNLSPNCVPCSSLIFRKPSISKSSRLMGRSLAATFCRCSSAVRRLPKPVSRSTPESFRATSRRCSKAATSASNWENDFSPSRRIDSTDSRSEFTSWRNLRRSSLTSSTRKELQIHPPNC